MGRAWRAWRRQVQARGCEELWRVACGRRQVKGTRVQGDVCVVCGRRQGVEKH